MQISACQNEFEDDSVLVTMSQTVGAINKHYDAEVGGGIKYSYGYTTYIYLWKEN